MKKYKRETTQVFLGSGSPFTLRDLSRFLREFGSEATHYTLYSVSAYVVERRWARVLKRRPAAELLVAVLDSRGVFGEQEGGDLY